MWKFRDSENTSVFTTEQVIKKKKPILYVSHDIDDGAWQFHHGQNVNMKDAILVSLSEIIALDNTLDQLVDLPLGWYAVRRNRYSDWEKHTV